jgi:hypothetical protein
MSSGGGVRTPLTPPYLRHCFAELKQAAKSNFAAVAFNDGLEIVSLAAVLITTKVAERHL